MDRLQQILAGIKKNLGGLNPSQKLLIGSLAIIMVMVLFLVSQYAGKASYVEVWPGANAEDQTRAAGVLKTAGFSVTEEGGTTKVPSADQQRARSLLAEQNQQPANSAVVFENILKTQNWINSKEQNRQLYKVMLDNWLSGVIGKFKGVESAKVFVDAPEQIGFGKTARPPKASVTIFTVAGQGLDQAAVEAAGRLVAGSVAGLELDRVSVSVDGRTRRVGNDNELSAATNQQSARLIETQLEQKLVNLLSYIDGVVVAVSAQVDTNRMRAQITKNLPTGEGTVAVPKKEMTRNTVDSQGGGSGQAGVHSNVQMDVATGNGSGARTTDTQEDIEYATAIGTETKEIQSAGGTATRLVATVAVPRDFVASLCEKEATAGADGKTTEPTLAEIEARFDKERVRIAGALGPHFKTRTPEGQDVQGEVVVMLVSGGGSGRGGGGAGGGASGGGLGGLGTMWAMGGGMVDKVVLGALAFVAVGMMLLMVRKAGKRVELPTPEELVGVPPTLEAKSDLVGEADESETAMAGIEVGEEEIKVGKMRESVSEFIKQNPDSASKLLNRWISVEQ